MLSVKQIIRLTPFILLVSVFTSANAQINSPFSRYGLGNEITNNQNTTSQAMGGLTTPYTASMNGSFGQSVNFNNPATYSSIFMTTFDLGMNLTSNTLKSNDPVSRFQSTYFVPNYLAIGIPINKAKKMGMAFGLRPITQVNYSINELKILKTGDSLYNNYVGQGGMNQAFIGFGKGWKNFSVGFNTGFNFGKKKIQNIKSFQYNIDSTYFYQSLASTNTVFNGLFFQLGAQGESTISTSTHEKTTDKTEYSLSYGITYTLDQKLTAKQDVVRSIGSFTTATESALDTASVTTNIPGSIKLPSALSLGIALHKKETSNKGTYDQWVLGIQFDQAAWKDKYSFYGVADQLSNSYMTRLGVQFCPNPFDVENYWSNVTYRAGFNFGKDYINIDQNGLNVSNFSVGMGLPVRKYRSYDYQFTVLNLALQFGQRGTSVNKFQESYVQFTVGYSLSDIWFNKRKYD